VKYVLDTNIVARLLDADERVLSHLTDVEPSDVGIPILVVAELQFGAEKSARREQNHDRVHSTRTERHIGDARRGAEGRRDRRLGD